MKYLLDTHVAIWALEDETKLSKTAKLIMKDTSISLCVSVVSVWEIAIKSSIGKSSFSGGSSFFLEKMRQNGVEILELKDFHISDVEGLPFHHRDPFDRILISIAIAENLTLLTADENIQKYNALWTW